MRELKFRAWGQQTEQYVYFNIGENPLHKMLEQPVIVEQYIGINDDKGNEIYEGDKVKYLEWFDGYGDKATEEVWVAELECNKFNEMSHGGADGTVWFTDIEIIGHIHEVDNELT